MDVEDAKKVIEDGGTVIFPTETAYGIAADALDPEAVKRVYEMKDRPREKGLTVIVDSLETAEKYAELSEREKKLVEEFMPGPLTLVAEKTGEVPGVLNEKFVFRVSSSELARKLAEIGPITATSANVSGNDTSYSVEDIDPGLREQADLIIDRGELEKSPTSTVAELVDGEIAVHREGPIKKEELQESI